MRRDFTVNLTNMRLSKRLTITFGLFIALTVSAAIGGRWLLSYINDYTDHALDQSKRVGCSEEVRLHLANIYKDMLLITASKNASDQRQYLSDLEHERDAYKSLISDLGAKAETAEEKAALAQIDAALAVAREVDDRAVMWAMNGKEAEAEKLLVGEVNDKLQNAHNLAAHLADWQKKQSLEASQRVDQIDTMSRYGLVLMVLIAVGAIVFFGVAITWSISKPILAGVKALERISKGDVTQDVAEDLQERKDEVGDLARAMQTMTVSLRNLLRSISGGVQTVASSATQLSAASNQTALSEKDMSVRSSAVAAAAEESCASTASVAESMEQASNNLTSVGRRYRRNECNRRRHCGQL